MGGNTYIGEYKGEIPEDERFSDHTPGKTNSTTIGSIDPSVVEDKDKYAFTVAVGNGAQSYGNGNISLGASSESFNNNSSALGSTSRAKGNYALSVGFGAETNGEFSTSIGSASKALKNNSTTIGANAIAEVEEGVALGSSSKVTRDKEIVGYDFSGKNIDTLDKVLGDNLDEYNALKAEIAKADVDIAERKEEILKLEKEIQSISTGDDEADKKEKDRRYKEERAPKVEEYVKKLQERNTKLAKANKMVSSKVATLAAVSVGNEELGKTRQIINVAAGTEDTDAVNVRQLKDLSEREISFKGDNEGVVSKKLGDTLEILTENPNGENIKFEKRKEVFNGNLREKNKTFNGENIAVIEKNGKLNIGLAESLTNMLGFKTAYVDKDDKPVSDSEPGYQIKIEPTNGISSTYYPKNSYSSNYSVSLRPWNNSQTQGLVMSGPDEADIGYIQSEYNFGKMELRRTNDQTAVTLDDKKLDFINKKVDKTLPLISLNSGETSGPALKFRVDAQSKKGTGKISGLADGEISSTSTEAINGSQIYTLKKDMDTKIDDSTIHWVNVNSSGRAENYDKSNSGAKGPNAIAIGAYTTTQSRQSVALGAGANISGSADYAVSLGTLAKVAKGGQSAIAIGPVAYVGELTEELAKTEKLKEHATEVTNGSETLDSTESVKQEQGDYTNSIAIGSQSKNFGFQSVAIGPATRAFGEDEVSIGVASRSYDKYGIALGSQAISQEAKAISIGGLSHALAEGTISFGYRTETSGRNAVAIGEWARSSSKNSVALGAYSHAAPATDNGFGVKDGKALYSNEAISAEHGVVSVGSEGYAIQFSNDELKVPKMNRRIIGVGGAIDDNDAVNLAQLKAVTNATGLTQDEIEKINANAEDKPQTLVVLCQIVLMN